MRGTLFMKPFYEGPALPLSLVAHQLPPEEAMLIHIGLNVSLGS